MRHPHRNLLILVRMLVLQMAAVYSRYSRQFVIVFGLRLNLNRLNPRLRSELMLVSHWNLDLDKLRILHCHLERNI